MRTSLRYAPSLALAFFLIPALAFPAAPAGPEAAVSSRPILFVHGFNPFGIGEDCRHDFSTLEAALAAQGFVGPMTTVGYYSDDRNCDVSSSPHGSLLTHMPDLSHDLAWYIYNQFSRNQTAVDVVAHSMGGLLLRYALYRIEAKDPTFPPFLLVTHAVAIASPFTGYSLIAEACHVNVIDIPCYEMFPGASFIQDLKNPLALVPQGRDGTLWSNIGSNAVFFDRSDGFVNSSSATSMKIPRSAKLILPWYKFVFHTLYTHNKTVIARVAQNLAFPAALPPSPAAPKAERSRSQLLVDATISRQELLQDFTQIPSDDIPAKIQPFLGADGETTGFQFTQLIPDGVFSEMGIEEGDVVSGCTPETVNTPFEALESLDGSSDQADLTFCITRGASGGGARTIVRHIVVQ